MSSSRDRFEERFRAWGSRPPRRPAGEASARVRERLEPKPRRGTATPGFWRWPIAAVTAAAAALLAVLLFAPDAADRSASPEAPPLVLAERPVPPTAPAVVVLVLEDATPLYLSLPSVDPRPAGAFHDPV